MPLVLEAMYEDADLGKYVIIIDQITRGRSNC